MEHDWTPPELMTGNEPLTLDGKPVGSTLLDFWRFQYSNIWDMQDSISEYIVAKALGQDVPNNKNGWTLWDTTYRGKRIEIKETGYFYSWQKDGKISPVRVFGIRKAYSKYKDNTSSFKRQNDLYIFCLNTGKTKEESNPLELTHWRFWVIPTSTINELCGDNKTISLGRVKKLAKNENGVGFSDLKASIDEVIDRLPANL